MPVPRALSFHVDTVPVCHALTGFVDPEFEDRAQRLGRFPAGVPAASTILELGIDEAS